VFLDTIFYAAVAPLLPSLAHDLHLSKRAAGLLVAAYPLGTLLGAIPGGILAARRGPQFAVIGGLALLSVSCVGFGVFDARAPLYIARFVQGIGGAFSWAGGMTWLVNAMPDPRRAGVVGTAIAMATAGSLFGPMVGSLAEVAGRPLVFCAAAGFAAVLIVWALRVRSVQVNSRQGFRAVLAAARRPRVLVGLWLMLIPASTAGVLNVLGPLRLGRLGASAAVIGAVFLIAGAIESATVPVFGRLADRRGRILPMAVGLGLATALLIGLTFHVGEVGFAIVLVATLASTGTFWAPATAMLSEAAEATGLARGLGFAIVNFAWAIGLMAGAAGGGALASAAGNTAALLVVAGICGVTLAALPLLGKRRPDPRRGQPS
jgi:predicted MFS family arabinose efflux permease